MHRRSSSSLCAVMTQQPSLEEKQAFFQNFRGTSPLDDDEDDEDDDLGALEEEDRLIRRRFFTCTRATASEHDPSNEIREVILVPESPPKQSYSAPQLAHGETVIPETTTSKFRAKRHIPDTSPSVQVVKKRRPLLAKEIPESQKIFKDLSFYFIPNNDVSPARRLRINKAVEHGATWCRDIKSATHVVADRHIGHTDVVKAVGTENGKGAVIVTEEYPIDCVRFGRLLEPNQAKYRVPGQPEHKLATEAIETHAHGEDELRERRLQLEKEVHADPVPAKRAETVYARIMPPVKAAPPRQQKLTGGKPLNSRNAFLYPPPNSEESSSLPLKPQHRDPRRWDYVPDLGRPLRSQSFLHDDQILASISRLDAVANDATLQKAPVPDDLSEYISMMQEFKELPLDLLEEDDAASTIDLADDSGSENEESQRQSFGQKRRLRSSNKAVAFEDRFACNHAGPQISAAQGPNARVIEVLQSMERYYQQVDDHWRSLGYRKAIATLRRQPVKVTTEDEAFKLPHIGKRLAQKIEEIAITDKLKRLEYAEAEPKSKSLKLFLGIYGVGTKQAQQWIAQGFRTLDDVRAKAKLTPSQAIGVKYHEDLNTKMPRQEVEALAAVVRATAADIDPTVELIVGGSYRRGSSCSNDMDMIVTKVGTETVDELRSFLDALIRQLEVDRFMVARLVGRKSSEGGSIFHGCCVLPHMPGGAVSTEHRPTWRRIDLLLVPETEMGGALIYFTGDDIFNRSIRLLASKKGMRLNQRGLFRLQGTAASTKPGELELIQGRDERRIFDILGVRWREPEDRWC